MKPRGSGPDRRRAPATVRFDRMLIFYHQFAFRLGSGMRSTLKFVNVDDLAADPVKGSLLVRLMMVLNDITLANESHEMWRKARSGRRSARRAEARRYAVRMMIAHMYEGMRLIDEIDGSSKLRALVLSCDQATQKEFKKLLQFKNSREFKKYVLMVRHKVAFHYDDTMVRNSTAGWAKENPAALHSISLGQHPLDWNFKPGEVIGHYLVVRDIFKIKTKIRKNARVAADKIMDEVFENSALFARFAGHFLWKVSTR
jgi:hypothetical protein